MRYNLRNPPHRGNGLSRELAVHAQGDGLTGGGKHIIKGYFVKLSILFTSNSYLCGRPNHRTDVELTAVSSKSLGVHSL